jgi:AraC family transcriptional regulator, regulatory protein of adaptative response / DNA-3-methyladenine glycosylase II
VFATTPTGLRAKRDRRTTGVEPGTIALRLAYRSPMDLSATLDFLGGRAIPGVETYTDGVYTRVIRAPGGPALVSCSAGDGSIACRVRLTDQRDLVAVVARVRRLLDLDADPCAVDDVLGADAVLAPLVAKRPGLRSPGAVDGFEMAVRAIVGQQISVAGARTVLGRIVAAHNAPAFDGEPWLLFPSAEAFAASHPDTLPMPRARAATLHTLARALMDGVVSLDPGADRVSERAALLALSGVGPWTADYLRMRALADPDVLLAGDLGVRKSAAAVGVTLDDGRSDWSPWRSYATHHFWAALH